MVHLLMQNIVNNYEDISFRDRLEKNVSHCQRFKRMAIRT